ncbi:hypothetical protein EsH8_XV_000017 [Colletotrichum jinshuiense]
MEGPWPVEFGSIRDGSRNKGLGATDSKAVNRAVVNRYTILERQITDTGVDVVDLRCWLPIDAARVVASCHPASALTPTDAQCLPKLQAASKTWGLDSAVCAFVLDASQHGRRFFQELRDFSRACPDWLIANQVLRRHANLRRRVDYLPRRRRANLGSYKGVNLATSGLVAADIRAAHREVKVEEDLGPDLELSAPEQEDLVIDHESPILDQGDTTPDLENPRLEQDNPAHDFSSLKHTEENHNSVLQSASVSPEHERVISITVDRFLFDDSDDDDGSAVGSTRPEEAIVQAENISILERPGSPESLSPVASGRSFLEPFEPPSPGDGTPSNAPLDDSLDDWQFPEPTPHPENNEGAVAMEEDGNPTSFVEEFEPAVWLSGAAVSFVLRWLCNLCPTAALAVDASEAEIGEKLSRQMLQNLTRTLASAADPVFILLPISQEKHWSLAVATISEYAGVVDHYDSLPTSPATEQQIFAEARGRLDKLVGSVTRSPQLHDSKPAASWGCSAPYSLRQPNGDDCGVAVLIHAFHVLARVPLPASTDWLLWRRVLLVFASAILNATNDDDDDDDDDDGDRASPAELSGGIETPACLRRLRDFHDTASGLVESSKIVHGALPCLGGSSPNGGESVHVGVQDVDSICKAVMDWAQSLQAKKQEILQKLQGKQAATRRSVSDIRRITASLRRRSAAALTATTTADTLEREKKENSLTQVRGALGGIQDDADTAEGLRTQVFRLEAAVKAIQNRGACTARTVAISAKALQAVDDELNAIDEQLGKV